MPMLTVALDVREERSEEAATFGVVARFTNRSDEPASLNLSQVEHPSLVLEVRDGHDRAVLLAPPHAPDRDEIVRTVKPDETVEIEYVGFLDRDAPPGPYRIRYFGLYEPLGGDEDGPLASEWLEFEIRESTRRYSKGLPLEPVPASRSRAVLSGFLWRFVCALLFAVRVIACAIRRFIEILLAAFGGERPCRRNLEEEVDVQRTETISDAPAGSEAWNGTYAWRSRFHVRVSEPECRVTVTLRLRTVGALSVAERDAWEAAIETAWNDQFKLCCDGCCCINGFPIVLELQWVEVDEHQVVNVGASTTNMTNWGRNDLVDVAHEVGHMLGALDEYFTVNGVAWGPGRQPDGAIMNNPANDPAARHYDTVQASAAALLGGDCSTVPTGHLCC